MAPAEQQYRVRGDEVSFVDPSTGQQVFVPRARVLEAQAAGLQPETVEAAQQREEAAEYDNPLLAGLAGAASSATFGLSDVLLSELGAGEDLAKLREHNPTASAIGDVGGAVAGAVVPGGPLARLGGAAAKVGGRAAGKLAGAAARGSRAARFGEVALPVLARGAAEGAALGAGAELGQQAREQQGYDAGKIARKALSSAATGAALSMAGLGISGAAKAAGRTLTRRGAQVLGKDAKAAARLVERERQLAKDLQRARNIGGDRVDDLMEAAAAGDAAAARELKLATGGWKPKGAPVERLGAELQATRAELSSLRQEIFRAAGEQLAASRGALGLIVGAGTESWAIGGAAMALSALAAPAAKGAAGVVGRALRAVGKPATGAARASALQVLSAEEAKATANHLEMLDPGQVRQDALAGYQAAGLPPGVAGELADFQGRRVELLQQAAPSDPRKMDERVRFSAVLAATDNPRGIVDRLRAGKLRPEDVRVLQELLPATYRKLRERSLEMADEEKAGHLRQLRLLIDVAARAQTAQTIANALHAKPDKPAKGQMQPPPSGGGVHPNRVSRNMGA